MPSRARFHFLFGTIRALRLPVVLPAALRFLRLAVPRPHRRFRSRAAADAPLRGLGVFGGDHPRIGTRQRAIPSASAAITRLLIRGEDRTSQVPAEPSCRRANAPATPEESAGTRRCVPSDTASDYANTRGFFDSLSKLNRMARRLAAYASPRRLPDPTQDWLLAAG